MAAIGPVGNVIFVNQQTAAVASEKNAVHNRFDLQNVAAAEATNEKQKEVEAVRPTEENHKVDEDREHTKQEAEEEAPKDREKPEKDDESEETAPLHLLDIKV